MTTVNTRPLVNIYDNDAVKKVFNRAITNRVTIIPRHIEDSPKLREVIEWCIDNHTHTDNTFLCNLQLQLWNDKHLSDKQIATAAQCFKALYGNYIVNLAKQDLIGRPQLNLGTYTIIDDKTAQYRTIRLQECPEGFNKEPGTQIAQFLSGPDNNSDFTGFAFIYPGRHPYVWKKYHGNTNLCYNLGILLEHDDAIKYGEAYAIESGRCYHCNRKLTVPVSIFSGLGPTCAKKLGIVRSKGSTLTSATSRPGSSTTDDAPLFDD